MAAEHRGQVKFGGLPLPGATVTVSRGETAFSTVTDAQGIYTFPDLADGAWTVQVEMLCFTTARGGITIESGSTAIEWELKLQPISEILARAETPAPPAAAPAPEKPAKSAPAEKQPRNAAGTQGSFQRTDVNAAPPTGIALPPSEGGAFAGQNPEDLAQRASDGFLITGSANNSSSSPFGLFPAFGNVRKGPASLYNGNIGFLLDNSALNARPYSFTGQDTAKPSYNRMTGTFSFGGPLRWPGSRRNGPNLFLNYQWVRNRNATSQPGRVPVAAERAGDFSQSVDSLGRPVRIFDPLTGSPFPGNVVPQNRISPQARALLTMYPMPNFSGSARYNYQVPIAGNTHQDSLQARLSKSLRKNQLSGNFDYQSIRTDTPNLFGFLHATQSTGLNLGLNWRHIFSMRLLGSLGYRFSRLSAETVPFFQNRRNISGEAGITGNDQTPTNWGPPDLIFAGGITTLADVRASVNRNQTSGITPALSWNRGRHNLSFGGEFRRQQINPVAQQNPRGTFTFTGAATQAAQNGTPVPGTGSDFGDFLLGIPDASSIAFGNADKYFRNSTYAAFLNDDWRINPGFTLNAGVRWEYGSPITELYGRLVNLDIAPRFSAAAPVVATNPVGTVTGQRYPDSLIYPDKGAIQPRVGISWRPFLASSMVVRAGYGIYYNTSVYPIIAAQMAQQSPLSKNLAVQNSPETPLTLADGFRGSPDAISNTFAVDPNFRVGFVHSWQLSIQRDLPAALAMVATYLGSRGRRGTQQFLPNTFPAGRENPCAACPAGFAFLASNGSSSREAGQIQLRRRLQSGFTATLQYTFSKSIDDAALGGRGQGAAVIAQDWLNLEAERALTSFDQRHLLDLQVQYTSGMGITGGALTGGWAGRLLKEWTVTTQIAAGSGFPLSPVYLTPVKGTGITGSLRPNRTAASIYEAPPGLSLNPLAYVSPKPGEWGNAGRNSITGPAQFVLNASVGRSFRLKDRVSLDFRVDSANAINHVNFPDWNTTVGSSQFGLPFAANPMRALQTTFRARF
jgi:hypothetical protein